MLEQVYDLLGLILEKGEIKDKDLMKLNSPKLTLREAVAIANKYKVNINIERKRKDGGSVA